MTPTAYSYFLTRAVKEAQERLVKNILNTAEPPKTDNSYTDVLDLKKAVIKPSTACDTLYLKAVDALINMVYAYLYKNILLIRAVIDEKNKSNINYTSLSDGEKNTKALEQYCTMGRLINVLKEYMFIIDLVPPESNGTDKQNTYKSIENMFISMRQYYEKNDEATEILCIEKQFSTPSECKQKCDFAERFTEDKTDSRDNKTKRMQLLQKLFNSPFYPFVMSTTSVAQEGLDFHNYCHQIVHWNIPKTPLAFEQREGRIDRYMSHLLRKRIVFAFPEYNGTDFSELMNKFDEKVKKVEKENNSNDELFTPLFPYWRLGRIEYQKLTGKKAPDNFPLFKRVVCAMPHTREREYFNKLRTAISEYRSKFGTEINGESVDLCPYNKKEGNENM